MSGTTSISGLVSGLDTTSIISQLMQLEAAPQTLLKNKQATESSTVSALQTLNTKIASLATAATSASDADSWKAVKATASATSVTATASSSATTSSLSFTVDAVAAAQSSLVTLPSSYDSTTPSFTITRNGQTTTITAQSTSTADVLAAFNGSGTGVTATSVSANGTTYLQLTGTDTGAQNAFSVAVLDSGGTPTNLSTLQVQAASDATITLWGGTPAQQSITQASNTFSGVLGGVDLTVSAVETDPVTVSVARNASSLSTLASNVVTNLNTVLSEISSRTASKTTTDSSGRTIVSGGLLSGDATISSLQQSLMSAGSLDVDGASLSDAGIEIASDGTFSFNADTFASAFAADPTKVQNLVSTMAQRVGDIATGASDSVSGSVTLEIQSEQSTVKDLGDQISGWDDRLAARKASLEKVYSALEVSLSNMKSQSDWLTSQISSLTSSSGG